MAVFASLVKSMRIEDSMWVLWSSSFLVFVVLEFFHSAKQIGPFYRVKVIPGHNWSDLSKIMGNHVSHHSSRGTVSGNRMNEGDVVNKKHRFCSTILYTQRIRVVTPVRNWYIL